MAIRRLMSFFAFIFGRGARSVIALALFLIAALATPVFAVWPMPPYSSYPNCGSVTPAENCSAQGGDPNIHWQVKLSERSVQFPATYSCTPVSGQFGGFCDGPGCTSQAGFCRQPAILGTPTSEVVQDGGGAKVLFHLEYDFPGNYCQLSPDGNIAEWPIVFNNTHLDRLQVIDAASGNLLAESMAVFEHGQWNPLLPFCGSGTYILRVLNECAGLDQKVTLKVDLSANPDVSLTPCAQDRDCFGCNFRPKTVGRPINVGSGDVALTLPLFTVSQAPMALSMSLTYHSQLAGNPKLITETMGRGWTHNFNQTLRTLPTMNGDLYRIRSDGDESWYPRSTSTQWTSIRPGELRESIALVNGQLQVTDLDGNVTLFDATSGAWLSSADRWGNAITGTYSNSLLTALTDAEGRQVQLAYTDSQLTRITLPDGTAWRLAYANGELAQIFDPIHSGSTPWRTFEYQPDTRGKVRLLAAMRDEAGALLEGHGYDALERGVSSYVGANSELVTLQYNGATPTQTVVTSSIDGTTSQTATFSLIYQRGRFLPLEVNGNCMSCGSNDDDEKLQFDASNFVASRTDGNGHMTTFGNDANGNVLTKIEAAGTPNQRTTTYAYGYAPWPRFITQMTEQSAATPGMKTTTNAWNVTVRRRRRSPCR